VHSYAQLTRLSATASRLARSLGRDPSPREIADELQTSVEQVTRLLLVARQPVSLEAAVTGTETRLAEILEDPDAPSPIENTLAGEVEERARRLLTTLTSREEKILRMRFGIGQASESTLQDVGRAFDLTRERIRQIEAKALQKLRGDARTRRLRTLIEDDG
jgi:RNA polymerase primary sigma factor